MNKIYSIVTVCGQRVRVSDKTEAGARKQVEEMGLQVRRVVLAAAVRS